MPVSRRSLVVEVVEPEIAEILRGKTPAQRIETASAAHRTARLLAEAGIAHQHPDWSTAQIDAELKRKLAGGAS